MNQSEKATKKFPWKIIAVIGFVILFLLLFPISITERASEKIVHLEQYPKTETEKLESLVAYFKAKGFTVTNYYPSYIQLEKSKIETNPSDEANKLSRVAYERLGKPVKVILVTDDGRFVGFYKGE